MPKLSIDYLNARRDAKPASGGTRYVVKRNAVDDRAQLKALDTWENAMLEVEATLQDFRSWVRNLRSVESVMQGETADDLVF